MKCCHGFDRLSFRSPHTLRPANVPCSAHALALQRIDLLHTVCTESPAFHRGGFSGEIAPFLDQPSLHRSRFRRGTAPFNFVQSANMPSDSGQCQSVLHLMEVSAEQPENILLISKTFWVLKCDKSREVKPEQSQNIPLMSVTFCVLK